MQGLPNLKTKTSTGKFKNKNYLIFMLKNFDSQKKKTIFERN
jgi:hypothetical protein